MLADQNWKDSAANSTPNKQNSGLCQWLTVTHKACLSSVSSLLLPVPVVPVTAIATVTAPNPPSLA
jgi:hypothetical protein